MDGSHTITFWKSGSYTWNFIQYKYISIDIYDNDISYIYNFACKTNMYIVQYKLGHIVMIHRFFIHIGLN